MASAGLECPRLPEASAGVAGTSPRIRTHTRIRQPFTWLAWQSQGIRGLVIAAHGFQDCKSRRPLSGLGQAPASISPSSCAGALSPVRVPLPSWGAAAGFVAGSPCALRLFSLDSRLLASPSPSFQALSFPEPPVTGRAAVWGTLSPCFVGLEGAPLPESPLLSLGRGWP